jgi:hypothetical protein
MSTQQEKDTSGKYCTRVNGDWFCIPFSQYLKEGFRLKHAIKAEDYEYDKDKSTTHRRKG